MIQKAGLWVWIFCLVAIGVMAASPFITQSSGQLSIEYIKMDYMVKGEGVDLYFHVHNSTGSQMNTSICNIHIYNRTGQHIVEAQMALGANHLEYEYELGTNISEIEGIYPYVVWCSGSESGFVSSTFEIAQQGKREDNIGGVPLAAIILMPILFAIMLIIAANGIDSRAHAGLKIGLFLFSYVMVFLSYWMAVQTVIRFYHSDVLQGSLGTMVYVVGVGLFIIISYFMIYAFYLATKQAAQDEKDKMQY